MLLSLDMVSYLVYVSGMFSALAACVSDGSLLYQYNSYIKI